MRATLVALAGALLCSLGCGSDAEPTLPTDGGGDPELSLDTAGGDVDEDASPPDADAKSPHGDAGDAGEVGEDTGPDAPDEGAELDPDEGPDPGVPDLEVGPEPDLPPACGPCPEGQVCWNDQCFAQCTETLDVGAVAATLLAPEIEIVGHACRSGAEVIASGAGFAGQPKVLELRSADSGATTTMSLVSWNLSAGLAGPVLGQTLAVEKAEGSVGLFEVFPPDDLGLSVDATGTTVAFAYATDDLGDDGAVLSVPVGGGAVTLLSTQGASAVVPLTASELLVSASGINGVSEGPSLYRVVLGGETPQVWRVGSNLGSGGGRVARDGDLVVVSGYSDAWPSCDPEPDPFAPVVAGFRVFALSLSSIALGGPVFDVACGATELEVSPDFQLLPGGVLVSREADGLYARGVTLAAEGGVAFGETTQLTSGDTVTAVHAVPNTDQLLLAHPDGYLVVAWAPDEPPQPEPGPEPMPEPTPEAPEAD